MINLALLALVLFSAPGWGDAPRTAVAAHAVQIGDSPEPIPPKR